MWITSECPVIRPVLFNGLCRAKREGTESIQAALDPSVRASNDRRASRPITARHTKKTPPFLVFASKCYLRTKGEGGRNGIVRGQPGRKNHKRQRRVAG